MPQTTGGRIISVLIGRVGMIFIGLTAAVATRALADTIKLLRRTDAKFRKSIPTNIPPTIEKP